MSVTEIVWGKFYQQLHTSAEKLRAEMNTASRGEFGDQARPAAKEPGQNQSARQRQSTMRRVTMQTRE